MKPQRRKFSIDVETIKHFKTLPKGLLSPVRTSAFQQRKPNKLGDGADETSSRRLSVLTSPQSQTRLLHERIELEDLKKEAKDAGMRALRGTPTALDRKDTVLRLTDVFDMTSRPVTRERVDTSRVSTPVASRVQRSGVLRGSAMQQGSAGEEYGWTVEEGSSMQFALSPEYQKDDFDRDFYQMFLSSNDTNKLDIDSWRATMALSKQMFPNTGVLSKHAATSAFGAQQMKFSSHTYPTKRLQAYGKWYVKDRKRWQPDFERKAGGVVPHDMLTAAQRERKRKLAEQCAVMEAVVAKHDISYVYRDAIKSSLSRGDKSLGTRLPKFLQELPAEKPEDSKKATEPVMQRQNPLLAKPLKRQPSRLQMAAASVRHGVQVARVAERSTS